MGWCLECVVIMQRKYGHHYPELLQFARIELSAPITNAWPKHEASAAYQDKAAKLSKI